MDSASFKRITTVRFCDLTISMVDDCILSLSSIVGHVVEAVGNRGRVLFTNRGKQLTQSEEADKTVCRLEGKE